MLLLGLKDIDCAASLKASNFHFIANVVNVEICSEGICYAMDGIIDHELLFLLDMLFAMILWHWPRHVVSHQIHLVQLIDVSTSLSHLHERKWFESTSPLFVAVANISNILAHLESLPMCSRCSLLLLFHELSNVSVVPDCSMTVVLDRFLELMDEIVVVDYGYYIFIHFCHIFQLLSQMLQSSWLVLENTAVTVELGEKSGCTDVLASTFFPSFLT